MTFIWGRGHLRQERTFKGLSGSSSPPESSHDETPVNLPAVKLPVAKYTEKNLQRIPRTVLKARAPLSDGSREKSLKAKSPDVYCGKSHMECYNFCQQCEDHFATTGAKDPIRIPFAVFFLGDRINFRWQQYKQKHEAKNIVPITWKKFKTFFCWSLGDSRAFVNSYWAKIKRNSQYHQEDVLDWVVHLEHLRAVLRKFNFVVAPNKDTIIRYF